VTLQPTCWGVQTIGLERDDGVSGRGGELTVTVRANDDVPIVKREIDKSTAGSACRVQRGHVVLYGLLGQELEAMSVTQLEDELMRRGADGGIRARAG
jgi:hypothetical protein